VYVRIRFRTHNAKTRARCSFDLFTKGVLVLRSTQPELTPVAPDASYEALVRIPANLLAETTYTINAGVTLVRGDGEEHPLVVNKALAFMVYGAQGAASGGRKGVINPSLDWTLVTEPNVVRA
jgi:hypothetical protein